MLRPQGTPRAHDDRANWLWMLDHCTSNTGVTESLIGANLSRQSYVVKDTWNSLAYGIDPLDPVAVPKLIAERKGIVVRLPIRSDVTAPIEEHLIVEWYSTK